MHKPVLVLRGSTWSTTLSMTQTTSRTFKTPGEKRLRKPSSKTNVARGYKRLDGWKVQGVGLIPS